ncbi:hypothetical protein BZG36_03363 [Bifiguratus adelaidae]|uniref:Uncharacterized protein n=1 Tax=Bifiguratus adelaidae TaxID=1938954 RepID=A0A261XXM0_9FUNG|nr:hypothetical protein BZG36_03363 [Bifiguratus adelaidae]
MATAWMTNSVNSDAQVAGTMSAGTTLAEIGTLLTTMFLYAGWPEDAPRYQRSNMIVMTIGLLGALVAIGLRFEFASALYRIIYALCIQIPSPFSDKANFFSKPVLVRIYYNLEIKVHPKC